VLETGARLAIMSARCARRLVVVMHSMDASVTKWIYTPALRTCAQPGLSVQPAWCTFSSTEFMCRSSVADSCINCVRVAVEAGYITTGVDHTGCNPKSRGPLWSVSVDGLGSGWRGIGSEPTHTSTVADPFTAKLLGNFEVLKAVWRTVG